MPLRSFTVGNYRSFVEPVEVQLRPLTLLFGYNNSGKSALARWLPLLGDSVSRRPGPPLNLSSQTLRGGGFEDLRSRHTGLRSLDLGLEWDKPAALSFHVTLQDLPERRQHVVDRFELREGTRVILQGQWKLPGAGTAALPPLYSIEVPGEPPREVKLEWYGLMPHGKFSPSCQQALEQLDVGLQELQSTLWVGAIRQTPPRVKQLPVRMPEVRGSDGDWAWDVLAWDKATAGPLLPRIVEWYAEHTDVSIDVHLSTQSYSLVVGTQQVNLVDTGEGLTQVLPALLAGAMAEQRAREGASYLVIEQPELHLHPAAHAPLASYFCKIARQEPAPCMLIETHSENFLFGVQLAVARGELDPERVLIYWVRQERGLSSLTRITLDEWARPDNWPRGVFAEETDLAEQLLEAREERGYS